MATHNAAFPITRDHTRDQSLASTASTAVADGALLAGPLLKRSEWLHVWNARFVVLTTEVLAWLRTAAVLDGGEKEQRAVLLHSSLRLDASDGETLQITVPGGAPLMFRASSAAELRSWHRVLGSLLSALQAEAAEVAAILRERSSLLAPRPCTELAHMGSRNMRASRITKVWYLCASASADESFARSGPLIDPYRASALTPTSGGAGLGGSGGSGLPGENGGRALLLLSLLQLPTAWPLWEGAAPRAFHSILEQLAGSGVPGLLPPIHAEALPRRRRVLVLRRLLPRGSLRDHMHAVSTPTLPSSVKYGTALLSHPASAVLAAAASAAALAAERSSRHSGSAPPRLNAALERSAVPLPARLASSVGRRVLAAAAALEARGLPASHLHAGNVLLDEHACRLSEYELPLLGLPPYHELLAKPRPHPLATEPFRVRPSTLAAAHLIYEMVAGASLSDAALARWEGSGEPAAVGEPAAAAADPASHHAWRLLRSIFLPPPEATEAPTIAAMLRSPFFAPEASAGAQPSSVADGGGRSELPSQWSSEEEAPQREQSPTQ